MKKIIPLFLLIILVSCSTNQSDLGVSNIGSTVYVGEEFTGAILPDHIMKEDSENATVITNIPGDSLSGGIDISSNF